MSLDTLPGLDFAALGRAMHELAGELFPITRSLTGPGYRSTLERLEQVTGPMRRHRFATGEEVFDWTIPREWTVRDAWIKGPDGELVVSLADHNLHLVSYSAPVHARMRLAELQDRLHSLPEQPDAIPYRTSYYREDWGFCLTHAQRERLPDGEYEVHVDADLVPGHVELGEVLIGPESAPEVLLSTYCCHPSMANNELSGPVVCAQLAAQLREREGSLRHRYRVLFVPETIGSIAYLSRFGEHLRERLAAGFVVTCVGDPGAFTYKRSRRGDALPDRIAEHVLAHSGQPYSIEPFVPFGSDERQFCSPGFDLPVGSLMRTMYHRFPEYHTSLDDLDFITPEALAGTLELYLRIVDALEADRRLATTQPFCEPQLSKRGLYPTTGGGLSGQQRLKDTMCLLNWCDGTRDLLEVAETIDRPLWALREVAEDLLAHGLLRPVD